MRDKKKHVIPWDAGLEEVDEENNTKMRVASCMMVDEERSDREEAGWEK